MSGCREFGLLFVGLLMTFTAGCACRDEARTFLAKDDAAFPIAVLVRGVYPVQQDQNQNCWAAAYAMMLSWRERRPVSMEQAVSSVGPEWVKRYRDNTGLDPQTHTSAQFIAATALKTVPPANHGLMFYPEQMLKHGPLWINADFGDLNHAVIMVGAKRDPTTGAMSYLIIDPRTGEFETMSDVAFFTAFEAEARKIVNSDLEWEFRFQILHW